MRPRRSSASRRRFDNRPLRRRRVLRQDGDLELFRQRDADAGQCDRLDTVPSCRRQRQGLRHGERLRRGRRRWILDLPGPERYAERIHRGAGLLHQRDRRRGHLVQQLHLRRHTSLRRDFRRTRLPSRAHRRSARSSRACGTALPSRRPTAAPVPRPCRATARSSSATGITATRSSGHLHWGFFPRRPFRRRPALVEPFERRALDSAVRPLR